MIRSSEGYAGLKNLSNTCYMNSLLTQLFMNVGFRDFMLQLDLSDPETTQRLLHETKKIFGYMQESWLKSVDPQGLVDTVRTYDNEPIDVTIQMDVDEFYNLLFDRWEAQILGAEERKKFRSFYGGQLVQQIKSKECPHISERMEPFSAIQCDIKDKSCLEESLQAYVEGEIMQGGEYPILHSNVRPLTVITRQQILLHVLRAPRGCSEKVSIVLLSLFRLSDSTDT